MQLPPSVYQSFAEKTGQAFFAYDLGAQQFVYQNQPFKDWFRLPEQEINPDVLLAAVHPDDQGYVQNRLKALLNRGVCQEVEFRVQFEQQPVQWVCLSASIVQEGQGELVVGHAEDITANRQYNDHLKKFSNKKDSILNILSHDLAAPLGMIQNLTGLLTEELQGNMSEDAARIIGLIEQSSRQGANLIREFMEQEFMESTQNELITRRVNMAQKLKEALGEYKGASGKFLTKHFQFLCSQTEIYAQLDDLKFLQAITNLISNALKFTPDGGTITVSLEDEADTVLVKVADNGVGIPQRYHAHLFDKFTQARRPGLKGEHTVGLGMSIVKTIIEWHRGKIWFESEEHKGTVFYIRIPKE
ncbi:PAS domain-containing sensor histidine kinase [Rufibacter immobilis]|uniref:PAS domain-containing sensor histidine kinase n=1 Tax=Rufibacter immobilis TaxID=1348778 RepID=UPI0035EA7107